MPDVTDVREQIARIIEPGAWGRFDEMRSDNGRTRRDREWSLERATLIIAALEPPPKPAGGETVSGLFPNCDAWGAAEWFDRLASAIRAQDGAVVEGDDYKVGIHRNIAASSAMRLVREFEPQVRAALAAYKRSTTDEAR